jgi:hypothetical protein
MDDDVVPLPRRFDQLLLDFNHLLDSVVVLDHRADQLPKEYRRRHDGGSLPGAVVTALGSRHSSESSTRCERRRSPSTGASTPGARASSPTSPSQGVEPVVVVAGHAVMTGGAVRATACAAPHYSKDNFY